MKVKFSKVKATAILGFTSAKVTVTAANTEYKIHVEYQSPFGFSYTN